VEQRIPLYSADGELADWVSQQRLARLQAAGLLARVVRHRKGHINRAILFRRPGEAPPVKLRQYLGTRYSFPEHLDNGYIAWALKRLGRSDELRPVFLAVLLECLRWDGNGPGQTPSPSPRPGVRSASA
jgi:hypothetical protein